jgi:putative membrane protein
VPAGPVDEAAPGGGRFDEAGDATRRTHLANERTALAWWRTGLTSVAVGLGIGKVIPELSHNAVRWPYAAIGTAYALLGVALMVYGSWRQRAVEEAVMRGAFLRPHPAFLWATTGFGAVLGILTAALIVVHP